VSGAIGYPLETLLRLRQRARESAEHAVALAVQALVRCRREEERVANALAELRARRHQAGNAHRGALHHGGAPAQRVERTEWYLDRLHEDAEALSVRLTEKRRAVASAELLVERRRAELTQAAQAHEALVKHRRRWVDGRRADLAWAQDVAQDELNGARFAGGAAR
jgi:flagellar biosynthesis chaperone FliJ